MILYSFPLIFLIINVGWNQNFSLVDVILSYHYDIFITINTHVKHIYLDYSEKNFWSLYCKNQFYLFSSFQKEIPS